MKNNEVSTLTRLELFRKVCRPSVADLVAWHRARGETSAADALLASLCDYVAEQEEASRQGDPDWLEVTCYTWRKHGADRCSMRAFFSAGDWSVSLLRGDTFYGNSSVTLTDDDAWEVYAYVETAEGDRRDTVAGVVRSAELDELVSRLKAGDVEGARRLV